MDICGINTRVGLFLPEGPDMSELQTLDTSFFI